MVKGKRRRDKKALREIKYIPLLRDGVEIGHFEIPQKKPQKKPDAWPKPAVDKPQKIEATDA